MENRNPNPNLPALVVPDRTNIQHIHQRMYDRMQQKLTQGILRKIRRGAASTELFGLIIDLDDVIWRGHLHLGSQVPAPQPIPTGCLTGRLMSAIAQRDEILRLTEQLLPAFQDYLAIPPALGQVHVLVFGAGMASPFTLHWGAELELEWE